MKKKIDKSDWIKCDKPFYKDRTIRPCYKCGVDTMFCERCGRDHHIEKDIKKNLK